MNSDSNYSFITLCLVVVGSLFVNEIAVSAFSFRGRCNYRPSSIILFVLFFLFLYFICMSAFFGSHFRAHDSHVTGEHMV